MQSPVQTVLRGALAGCVASTIQAAIGKTEEKLLLPPHEDADIAPRLVKALARQAGTDVSPAQKWVLGTLFHYAYGAGWGAAYALGRELSGTTPARGGGLMGGLIYGLTFPPGGLGEKTRAERPRERRTRRMELVALSVSAGFGLAAALCYEAVREQESEAPPA